MGGSLTDNPPPASREPPLHKGAMRSPHIPSKPHNGTVKTFPYVITPNRLCIFTIEKAASPKGEAAFLFCFSAYSITNVPK